MMNSIKSVVAGFGLLVLAACGSQGTYYETTPAQAASTLRTARLPLYVLGSSAKGAKVTQPDEGTVVIAPVDGQGSELARFVATITPDGSGSRVAVAVMPPEGRNKDQVARNMQGNAIASALLERVAAEHVAAAMEHRSFDMSLGNPVVNAMPGMKEQFAQANEAAMAVQDLHNAIDDAKAAKDGWGSPAGGSSGGSSGGDWGDSGQ